MSGNAWVTHENGDKGGQQREVRWLTPKPVVEALGLFDLDPCGAPGHDLAAQTYLPERSEDGLLLPWHGRVWLNPPYGKMAAPFLRRMAVHQHGIALIFARTETAIFHETVWQAASGVLFLKGRLSFLDGNGVRASANAGAPSCLVAYGSGDAAVLASRPLPGAFVDLRTVAA